jgi:hypothetical protein
MPSWYALTVLDDARTATEDLLRPVDRGRWLRLAVIALFVGVGGSVPSFGNGGNVGTPSGGGGGGGGELPGTLPSLPEGGVLAAVAAVVLVLVLLVLAWSLVGAVMEFVLVVGLRDREIRLKRPFRANLRRGLRLFGFRIGVGLASLLVIGVPVALVFVLGVGVSPFLFALALPLAAVALLVGLAFGAVSRLTTDFVVPTMIADEVGVLDGWRRLWPTLRGEWKQTAVYLVARFVLGIAAGLVVGLGALLVGVVLAIPFVIVGILVFALAHAVGSGAASVVLIVPLALLYFLALFVGALILQVPVLTFVRYYSLSALGYFVPELDFVGVDRDGESDADDGEGGGPDDGDDPTDDADADPVDDGEDGDTDENQPQSG